MMVAPTWKAIPTTTIAITVSEIRADNMEYSAGKNKITEKIVVIK